jgi:anaerobic ribonucleoside-triphosphate reductase activating protein
VPFRTWRNTNTGAAAEKLTALFNFNIPQRELVALLDVLVDGRFEKALADPGLLWRGSSNQMVHDLNAWRKGGERIPCLVCS